MNLNLKIVHLKCAQIAATESVPTARLDARWKCGCCAIGRHGGLNDGRRGTSCRHFMRIKLIKMEDDKKVKNWREEKCILCLCVAYVLSICFGRYKQKHPH